MDYLLDPRYAMMQTMQQYQQMNAMNNAMRQQANAALQQMQQQLNQLNANTPPPPAFQPNAPFVPSESPKVQPSEQRNSSSRHECPRCHGKGRVSYDSYPGTYGSNDYKVRCNECGQTFNKSTGHSHINCPQCHGKGSY